MKLSVLSDLHLECGDFLPAAVSADITVLAGDIWRRDRGIRWAAERFRADRTVYLLGNHEFHMEGYRDVVEACQSAAAQTGVHFLENRGVVIDGVRFIGANLWSDFRLEGDGERRHAAMDQAARSIDDFRYIFWTQTDGKLREFRPGDAVSLHGEARAFLEAELGKPFPGPSIVVTHFLPHRHSIAPKFKGSPLNPYFCSDLGDLIEQAQPALWIHGHAHESCDYRLGKTRVISNPRGYAPDELNPAFDPAFIVEI